MENSILDFRLNGFQYFREFAIASVMIMITVIMYIVLMGPISQVYTYASSVSSGTPQNALDFTLTLVTAGFIFLILGLLAWGAASAVRRGEDTGQF